MENFNPVVFNCILLYLTVIFLSLVQSRFRILKDDPWLFFLLLILSPLLVLGKMKNIKTWTGITGFEIWGWTLALAFLNSKRIVPKINEGYIYAYTLFHCYLLIDTINVVGFNFWTILVSIISIYPTILIVKSSLEHKKLEYKNKLILYYWFLFAISFTYIDQVSLDIIVPILALHEVSFWTTTYVLITAVQLYFIATSLSLLFVGIPIFHLSRSSEKWKVKWSKAKSEWKEIVNYKLGNYVEYQISFIEFFLITLFSMILFYIDSAYDFRLFLILFYTVIFPLIFFYFKSTPDENIEEINNLKESNKIK